MRRKPPPGWLVDTPFQRLGDCPYNEEIGFVAQYIVRYQRETLQHLAYFFRKFDFSDRLLEKNPGGIPEEELSVPHVAREHRVRGVPRLLPDLERRDARPCRARRKAGAEAVAREAARVT